MSPSKLDPQRKARDHRRNDKERKKRKRHHEKPTTPLHVDATSIVFASQQPDAESRYIFLEVLPDMAEEWIDKMVFLRSPATGTPDRSFLGIQNLDDSLVWIELSLATAAPPNEGNEPPPAPDPSGMTFVRHYTGLLGTNTTTADHFGIDVDPATGYIWIADGGGGRYFAVNPTTGARVTTLTATHPRGIAVNPIASTIYAVNSRDSAGQNSQVLKTTNTGGSPVTVTGFGVKELEGCAVNPAGTHLYVANQTDAKIQRVRLSDHTILDQWTHANMQAPHGLWCASDGRVFVTDTDITKNVVHVFSATGGTLLATIGVAGAGSALNGRFSRPMGVWGDGANRLYVVDQLNDRVQIFDQTSYAFRDTFGVSGAGDGEFGAVSDITGIDLGGGATRVYVHDITGSSSALARISVWDIDASV